jgi:lipid-A-disaccharide synthase
MLPVSTSLGFLPMTNLTIFLSAGEPSGDFLGSQLMKALKSRLKDQKITFVGVGGALMEAQGLSSPFPIEELSVMGLAEVVPHIFHIRRRIRETVQAIEATRPDIVITIDSPGFNFRVGKALKKGISAIPLVHYGAPSVWAWRPGRARKVAQFLDHLLVLFPFEPPYFLMEGLPTTFVGHPVVELGLDQRKEKGFRTHHKIPVKAPILTLLPGSRRSEISRLLPVFQETVVRLRNTIPNLHIVIPTLPHLEKQIQQSLTIPATILTTQEEKFDAYQESRAALAASGTVSLELAVAGVPMVIAYKINPITHSIIRRLVRVEYACLVNLLLNRAIIPERLQKACTPTQLAAALDGLLKKESEGRANMIEQMGEAVKKLTPPLPHLTPSDCAASQICRMLGID